jgi:hypothetical protein
MASVVPWLVVSDTGSATAGAIAAPLMLATSRLLASTGRPEFGRGALAGVERAFRAQGGVRMDRRGVPPRERSGSRQPGCAARRCSQGNGGQVDDSWWRVEDEHLSRDIGSMWLPVMSASG